MRGCSSRLQAHPGICTAVDARISRPYRLNHLGNCAPGDFRQPDLLSFATGSYSWFSMLLTGAGIP
jgi:hypothetical protein